MSGKLDLDEIFRLVYCIKRSRPKRKYITMWFPDRESGIKTIAAITGTYAYYAMKPLFIPLNTAPYEQFKVGTKDTEYRRHGARWNERTCLVGRRVTLSKGYGKKHRLHGTIIGFEASTADKVPNLARYYSIPPTLIACIKIKLDPQ